MTQLLPAAPSLTYSAHTAARWRLGVLLGGYLLAYVTLDWLSYLRGITPWNPQSGLTLALLMTAGRKHGTSTGLAVLLAVLSAELIVRGLSSAWLSVLLVAIVVTGGYLLAAYVLRKRGVNNSIDTPEQVISFICVIAPITLIVSTLYVMLLDRSQGLPTSSIVRYWVGDLNGVLSLTPLLLAAKRWRSGMRLVLQRYWEALIQTASMIISLWIRLGQHTVNDLIYVYPIFVPVIWIAFRWGVVGTALCTLLFQIALIVAADGYADADLLINMQILAVTLGTTGLLLGSVVSSRAAALRRIATQEAEQRAILTTAPDAVVATDAHARIVSANPAAVQLFQLAEAKLIGQTLRSRLPHVHLETVESRTANGRVSSEALRSDDSLLPVDVAWARLDAPAAAGFILIIRDVTERLASAAQLRERDTVLARAMRFAVVGEFASALTHELNQPITALVSYLRASQILAAPLNNQDSRLGETLAKAAKEAIRTSEVLRRLRDFYRGGTPLLTTIDVAEVVSTVLKSYEDRLKQMGVRLRDHHDSSIPTIIGDRTQIEMILHNLLNNALDAVADCPPSHREIAVKLVQQQNDVLLTMEDTGAGISAEIAASLFDPFVTTKPSGMGLGLAISRSLLRSHGGDLWSEPGSLQGARFVVRMPIRASTQIAL